MSIRYVGHLPGSAINIGAQLGLVAGLQGQLTVLQGRLANMSAQLSLVLKVQIPDPVTLTAGLQAALAGVADIVTNLPTASIDLTASLNADIGALTLQVQVLEALVAQFSIGLGASVHAWSYSGAAGLFGPALTASLQDGLPDGLGPNAAISGLVLASEDSSAWANFSLMFKVG